MRTEHPIYRPGQSALLRSADTADTRGARAKTLEVPEAENRDGAPLGFNRHDHGSCVAAALSEAESQCEADGLRLTPARRRVLEILLEEHRALGAYDVLERMRIEGLGAQPPAAYRALDFLVTHGFAHRIEGLNAFVACAHPGEAHVPAFLHCNGCGAVAEARVSSQTGLLERAARETGFAIEGTVIEATGLCPECQSENGTARRAEAAAAT